MRKAILGSVGALLAAAPLSLADPPVPVPITPPPAHPGKLLCAPRTPPIAWPITRRQPRPIAGNGRHPSGHAFHRGRRT